MSNLINIITPFVEEYGIIGLFFLSIAEEIAVPIPSSLPLLAAGFFSLSSYTSFLSALVPAIWKVGIPGALGLTIGGIFGYSVAYLGGEFAIRKWGKWLGISWQSVERFQRKLSGGISDEILIVIFRAIPFFPNIAVSVACGLIHYPMKKFLITAFLGTFLRAFSMGMLGWYLGASYMDYVDRLTNIGIWIAVGIGAITILFIGYLFVRKRLNRNKKSHI